MTTKTRKQIIKSISSLQSNKIQKDQFISLIDSIRIDEQEKLDNISGTSLEYSDTGIRIQESVDLLDSFFDSVEEDNMENAMEKINELLEL